VSPAVPTPLSVITGFLGSGKTTLLQGILRRPEMAGTAVIINEIGAVGLDHMLVREVATDVFLLDSGCLCCALRDDLVETLRDLAAGHAAGTLPLITRVILETSGLASPGPILRTLLMNSQLRAHYAPERVITTVDGVVGCDQLAAFIESAEQVAAADVIIITKSDLADVAVIKELRRTLSMLNPGAAVLTPSSAGLDPTLLFSSGARFAWRLSVGEREDASGHTSGIGAFTLGFDQPVEWDDLLGWLDWLLAAHGPALLRLKGAIEIVDRDRPVVVQAVHHLLFPPEELLRVRAGRRGSFLVLVGRDLPPGAFAGSLQQAVGVPVRQIVGRGLRLTRMRATP